MPRKERERFLLTVLVKVFVTVFLGCALALAGPPSASVWESYHDPALNDQGYCAT